MKENLPQRKRNRLECFNYSSEGFYFITICIKDKLPLLGKIENSNIELSREGITVEQHIKEISEIYDNVVLDEYVIMPNHIHIVLNIATETDKTISTIIGQFKRSVSKEVAYSFWQKSFHEHIIRNEKQYYIIKEYIRNNVINWEDDMYYA